MRTPRIITSSILAFCACGFIGLHSFDSGVRADDSSKRNVKIARGGEYMKAFTLQGATLLEPLVDVEQRRFDVSYITKSGAIEARPIRVYIPNSAPKPTPVVFVPHYEMSENSSELRGYLARGWSVASPCAVGGERNGQLTDDDLVFNCAALRCVRHMPEFDPQRVALVGGSAGGYMTLMLDALQMGICVSVANSPITNVYFNFEQFFTQAEALNNAAWPKALAHAAEKGITDPSAAMMDAAAEIPMTFIGLISASFDPILNNFPDKSDVARWEALSPVGLADCFSSPIVVNHNTSDVLVPVDQITREFTYDHEGETMPEGLSTRLPKDNPGKLGRSLVDELPKESTSVRKVSRLESKDGFPLPYDSDKLFNIVIYDDGVTESFGTHTCVSGLGAVDCTPYLAEKFEAGLAKTEILTSGKLKLMLRRYLGKSVQLPAREGVDDSLYGSLAVYRQEVVEEFAQFANSRSLSELDAAIAAAVAEEEDSDDLTNAWKEIEQTIGK